MSTPTCASGKFTPAYSRAARILAPSPVSLNLYGKILANRPAEAESGMNFKNLLKRHAHGAFLSTDFTPI
ncbi:MAG: hypothetical protein WA056_13060 [Gallionella sp.]